MNDLYALFSEFGYRVFVVLAAVLVVLPMYIITLRQFLKTISDGTPKKKIKEKAEEAFNLLKKGYEQKNLSEASIRLIYDRLLPTSDYDNDISYVDFLETFLIYIRKEDKDKDGGLTKSIEELILPILQKEKEEKPYSGVQEGERRILLAIEESAKSSELKSLKKHLDDLAVIIENNQKSLDKSERTNKWSIPTSIAGLVLTLVFGCFSIWVYVKSINDVHHISEKEIQQVILTIDSINKQSTIDAEKKDSLHKQTSVKDKK